MALTSPESVGVWWRGILKIEGDRIIPIKKEAYNPFEYYFPAGMRNPKDETTRSLPYQFLGVNASVVKDVYSFCERFGVLGEFSLNGWKHYASTIERAFANPRVKAGGLKGLFESEKGRGILMAGAPPLSILACPMTIGDFRFAQKQLQETIEWIGVAKNSRNTGARRKAQKKVQWRFREKLSMLRPYASWNLEEEQWTTGWEAGSLESLLYLMLLYDCQGRGHVRKCPWCKKMFMATRPKQKYHNSLCGNNARVYKHRHPAKERQEHEKERH
jgi:hypothetical protein